ncbi:hypothetical protein MMC25_002538 [Agyrium rufum]|nr:hypothetical protein [Agyrium rufum]
MVTNDLNGKPFQLKFVRAAQMIQFANVVCDPPLGQCTVLPHGQSEILFTVLIESSISFPEQPWEATLWHNCHTTQEWGELKLEEETAQEPPLSVNSTARPKVYRRYFSSVLKRPSNHSQPFKFTLKYRTSSSPTWKWVNSEASIPDGEIYFQAATPSTSLKDYFEDLGSSFEVEAVSSDVKGTLLWSLKSTVEGTKSEAEDEEPSYSELTLGTPRDFSRWFALIRLWSPWLAPRHGKQKFKINEDGVLCSFLREDGLHLTLLAVSGIEDILTVFKHDGKGNVTVGSWNDSPKSGTVRIIVAVGRTFEESNAACMYHARSVVAGGVIIPDALQKEYANATEGNANAEWMENWYDGLTYCTWNGLGQDLTEEKIFNALDTLRKNDIKITNLIIDDNWQSLDNPGESQFKKGWTDFEANKEGFPRGLRSTVIDIRDNHPNIAHVAVWHALLGYWGGVSPTGNIAKKYKTKIVKKGGIAAGEMTVVDASDAQRMYNDFYAFLLDAQIDSVKTDAQFFLDLMTSATDRRRFTKAYQDAWSISSLRYFATKAISCMSQIPQILFHSQLPTNKPRLMVRNSDDFFPEIPTSHPWHVYTNAYTSLLTSHLNVLPDLDMFQTSHPYSSFHAAARCVSGGPIYFTDEPGKHDVDLIKQMTARSPRAKTIILRPSTVGKALDVYTGYSDERLLKFGTYHGHAETGSSILGLFNVSERPLSELVPLSAFPGVTDAKTDTKFLVRAHTTGEISEPMSVTDKMPLVSVALETKGWEILTSYPLQTASILSSSSSSSSSPQQSNAKPITFAILGLLGKMTGAAAILNVHSSIAPTKNKRLKISIALKAMGSLGIWISGLKEMSIEDNFFMTMLGKPIPLHCVAKSEEREGLLLVDVERAWVEMDVNTSWGNEVGLEVFVAGGKKEGGEGGRE